MEIEPRDFGLTERTIDEVHARESRQARLFARLLFGGCSLLGVVLTALIYAYSAGRDPLLGLLVAPLLGLAGAVIGGLPIAVASAVVSWLVFPTHPQARALERYEAARAGIRVCEVCVLARGDDVPKEGVAYCSRCGAWICPECRSRYDLRAIAALKRHGRGGRAGGAGTGGR
jgi:hypothetical protein